MFSDRHLLKTLFISTLTAVFFCLPLTVSAETEYLCLQVALHLDSNVSGGRYSPEKLVDMAEQAGLDALIFCDHDRFGVEYGIPPFRNLIKKRFTNPSLESFGFDRYLRLLDSLDRATPALAIIPGAEVNPLYYWSEDPFRETLSQGFDLDRFTFNSLTLKNWHQHLMVIGLSNPGDYQDLPATASKIHPPFKYYFSLIAQSGFSALLKSPLVTIFFAGIGILLGIRLFFKRSANQVDFYGQTLKVKRKPLRKTAAILITFCLALIIDRYPFTPWLNSPYGKDDRTAATQRLIDYVAEKGGLIYFAHPEAGNETRLNDIKISTLPAANLLLKTENYTGFAVFGEGFREVGAPGGIWDRTLRQYCAGERSHPVWAVGELDFEGDLPDRFLEEVSTFVWAEENSPAAILQALAAGRCYASQFFAPRFLRLKEWSITSVSNPKSAVVSGENLSSADSIILNIEIGFAPGEDIPPEAKDFSLFIVRDGKIIHKVHFKESLKLKFRDLPPEDISYYRLWLIQGEHNPIIAANPIFVDNFSHKSPITQ